MTLDEAAKQLKRVYEQGIPDRKQAVAVHLFGIRFSGELDGMSLKEITLRAGLPPSYATEIRKGINLADFVTLKGGSE